jgi:hypothetical protein
MYTMPRSGRLEFKKLPDLELALGSDSRTGAALATTGLKI